jgi:glycosyltransferase involved in cell wall biosynthesis
LVGVPPLLGHLPPTAAVGRIWAYGIAGLREHADVELIDPAAPRRRFRGPHVDVWLTDGHQGPLAVRAPVVTHFNEASWADPLLDPAFVERYEGPSAEAAAQAKHILTISESSKRQIIDVYRRDPADVSVAYTGVDRSIFHPGVNGAAHHIAAAGGDPEQPYVLFVSTLHPRKNLAALRDAVAGLARRGLPHALVLVAGPPADRTDTAGLAAEATSPIPGIATPVVNLAGASDEVVAALMGGAAALCQPSLMEGFGMAVAEAMACGTPVVVTDRGSLPEVVDGAGLVAEPTAVALEDALARVLSDEGLARDLSARGIEVARRYTWKAMVDVWWEVVQAAVSRP